MDLVISEILPYTKKSGILIDNFRFANGAAGYCHASIYRTERMVKTQVTVKGVGRRNFALAWMPLDWTPKVGDTVQVPQSQL